MNNASTLIEDGRAERKRGRSPTGNNPILPGARVPQHVIDALRDEAARRGRRSHGAIIREALEFYLTNIEAARKAA
jgi:Ribbon-helix-helix protein, copG family